LLATGGGLTPAPPPPLVLHSFGAVSIKDHVLMTLVMKNANYSWWVSYFKSMCGKFGVRGHIDGTIGPHPADPHWDQADCCVHSWIFDSVLDLAMEGEDQTARDLWVAIKALFHANKEPRAIFLSHEFHSMTQGESSISEYCQRMKIVANALCDVGHDV
jgi:hypothetical protein